MASSERGCAERGRLVLGGDLDGHAEQIGLKLHQKTVRGCSAVGSERRRRLRERVDDVRHLVGDRLERGTDEVGARSCRVSAR